MPDPYKPQWEEVIDAINEVDGVGGNGSESVGGNTNGATEATQAAIRTLIAQGNSATNEIASDVAAIKNALAPPTPAQPGEPASTRIATEATAQAIEVKLGEIDAKLAGGTPTAGGPTEATLQEIKSMVGGNNGSNNPIQALLLSILARIPILPSSGKIPVEAEQDIKNDLSAVADQLNGGVQDSLRSFVRDMRVAIGDLTGSLTTNGQQLTIMAALAEITTGLRPYIKSTQIPMPNGMPLTQAIENLGAIKLIAIEITNKLPALIGGRIPVDIGGGGSASTAAIEEKLTSIEALLSIVAANGSQTTISSLVASGFDSVNPSFALNGSSSSSTVASALAKKLRAAIVRNNDLSPITVIFRNGGSAGSPIVASRTIPGLTTAAFWAETFGASGVLIDSNILRTDVIHSAQNIVLAEVSIFQSNP